MFQRKHPTVTMTRAMPSQEKQEQLKLHSFVSNAKKYTDYDPRQQQLTESLVLFVACDLIPFSVVDSPYFQALLTIYCRPTLQ